VASIRTVTGAALLMVEGSIVTVGALPPIGAVVVAVEKGAPIPGPLRATAKASTAHPTQMA
jgi:hypothetical protein